MKMEFQMALAATLLAPMVFVLHVVLSRVFGARHAVRWMFASFLVYLVTFVVIATGRRDMHVSTAQSWVTGLATVGFWSLGYMEAFSMLCRGFSLNLLIQLADRPGLSLDEIISGYGGVGADGLLEKRLATLERLRLVERHDDRLTLQSLAAVLICPLTGAYKTAFRVGAGG